MNKGCSIQLFDQDADRPSIRCDKGCDVRIAELEQELRDVREERDSLKEQLERGAVEMESCIAYGVLAEALLPRDLELNDRVLQLVEMADALASELEECEREKQELMAFLSSLAEYAAMLHDHCGIFMEHFDGTEDPVRTLCREKIDEARAALKRHGGE